MIDIDFFTYRKDPIVRINRIGIYPLDDEGRAKYYSKESYTHHFLRKTDPSIINQIIKNKFINEDEEQKIVNPEASNNQNNNLNTLDKQKTYEGVQTEPNQNYDIPNALKNNTISTTRNHLTLNQRYLNSMNAKKNVNFETEDNKNDKDSLKLLKTFNNSGSKKMAQSFDKKARLTGLKVFKNKGGKTNDKLPLIMGGFNHGNSYVINNIRTDSKEMGEKYNPYNFISPHVNRTKRNYVGGLFHG